MSFTSKPFWEQKFSDLNEVVDGRQMGSSKIDPSTWIAQGVFIAEDVVIEENDHVILFLSDKRYIPAIEKMFQVGMFYL